MYIYVRKSFKKIYEHHFNNSYDIHLYSINNKTNSHVPRLDLFMCFTCKFSWIVKPQHMLNARRVHTYFNAPLTKGYQIVCKYQALLNINYKFC